MRRRLLLSTLAAVAGALVLLGLPLAVAVRSLATQQALNTLQRNAEDAQVALNRLPAGARGELLAALAQRTGARLVLFERAQEGVVRVDDTGPPPPDAAVRQAQTRIAAAATGGDTARAAVAGVLAVAVPVRVAGLDQVLLAVAPAEELRRLVRGSWLAIGGLAFTALAAAALAALWQGRQLAAPLEDLAASARRLGRGDFSARAPRSGLPEPDDVATALDSTADRLAAMLERSRSFGADASHQLRTPLTALRLDLEALEAAGADPALSAAALAEVDRLDATIGELLALAQAPAGDEEVDLAALAADRVEAWQGLAAAQGRRVILDARPVPRVRARAAAIGQSLQVLLDNALEHGAGTITVSIDRVQGRDASGVRLCVSDQGGGLPDGAGTAGSDAGRGRGLPLARSLVEAEGGRLRLERARAGARVCLLLPAPERRGPQSVDGLGA